MVDKIKPVKSLVTPYFKKLFTPKKKKQHYSKNSIALGHTVYPKGGGIYYLSLKDAIRAIIVGSAGSGKTFFGRAICDRAHESGKGVVVLSDIKNEMESSRLALQDKFRDLLLPHEVAKGMPMVVLRPTFFSKVRSSLPSNNFWYSIDMKRFTRADFMTLLNVDQLAPNQKIAMEIIYNTLTEDFKNSPNASFTVSRILEIIDRLDISEASKSSLKFKFTPLTESNFYLKQYERSIINLLQKNYMVAINLEDYDKYGKGGFLFPEVTLGIVHREIVEGRKQLLIPPLFIFIDESVRFIGNDKNTSLKQDILEGVDITRRYDVSYFLVAQFIKDLPEKIIKQSRYAMLPSTVDTGTIRDALLSWGLTRNQQYALNHSIYLKKEMLKYPHSWLICDRELGKKAIITPLAPLSWHKETKA